MEIWRFWQMHKLGREWTCPRASGCAVETLVAGVKSGRVQRCFCSRLGLREGDLKSKVQSERMLNSILAAADTERLDLMLTGRAVIWSSSCQSTRSIPDTNSVIPCSTYRQVTPSVPSRAAKLLTVQNDNTRRYVWKEVQLGICALQHLFATCDMAAK